LVRLAQSLPALPASANEDKSGKTASPQRTAMAKDTGELTITSLDLSSTTPLLLPEPSWTNRHRDPVWERYLALASKRQLAAQQFDKAWTLAEAMPEDAIRWEAELNVIEQFQRLGNMTRRNETLEQFEARIAALSDKPMRVDAFGSLAVRLRKLSDPKRSGDTGRKAEKLVSEMPANDEKIIAQSLLALHHLGLDQEAKAESFWRDANRALAKIQDPGQRLSTAVAVAETYSRAGRTTGAATVLNGALTLAERIPDDDKRYKLLHDIAVGFASADDGNSALKSANRLPTKEGREQALWDVSKALLGHGESYSALAVADALEYPAYRAMSRAGIAWSLKTEKGMDGFAGENLALAIKAAGKIGLPVDQAIAAATVSRFAAWMRVKTAEEVASNATEAAARIDNPEARDLTQALIAIEQARGQMMAQSHASAAQIVNSELTLTVTDELAALLQLSYSQP
jgi:hypothetical protein